MATPPSRPPRAAAPGSPAETDFAENSRRPARMVSRRSNPGVPLSQIRITSNLSSYALCELADRLTPEQQAMLAAAGFSFVMHLRRGYKVDRARAVWLLARVRHTRDRLVFHLDGRGDFVVSREAAFDILGIPGGTNPVQPLEGLGCPFLKSNVDFGRFRLNVSVRRAREVAEAIAGSDSMSADDRRAFLASMVILAVGTFLAPTGSNCGEVDGSVLQAVSGNASVGSYDWQGFVLKRLGHAAAHVRTQIGQGCPEGKILLSGCTALLVMYYYSRCIGISFPNRLEGAPMISCFDASVMKELDKVDQQRRSQFHSWNVLTDKRHFDTEQFLKLVNLHVNNAGLEAGLGSSRAPVEVGPFVGGPGASTRLRTAGVRELVHVRVLEMVQGITTELAEKHGHLFGGPQALTYGSEMLVRSAFEAIESEISEMKALWGLNLSGTAPRCLDAEPRVQVGTNINTGHETSPAGQRLGYDGRGKDGLSPAGGRLMERGNGQHSGCSVAQNTPVSCWTAKDDGQFTGSARCNTGEVAAGMGAPRFDRSPSVQEWQTPGLARCSSQAWSGFLDAPTFDKSQSLQGSGSTSTGLDLLAEAMVMQACTVTRKRVVAEGQGEHGQRDTDGILKFASLNMICEKKRKLCFKPLEGMIEEFSKHDGWSGVMQSTLINAVIPDSIRDRVWVHFGSPVQVDLSGEEFLYYFASGKPWDLKMMAAAVALFKELDDKFNEPVEAARLRFFVDPRIMIFGARHYEPGEMCDLLENPYLSFEPTACEMAIAPLLLDGGWLCLAIHLKENKVTVFQPYPMGAPGLIGNYAISKIAEKILGPLLQMIGAASGVSFAPPSHWTFERFPWTGNPVSRYIDMQAVVVALFALFFDGEKVVWDLSKECSIVDSDLPPRKRFMAPFKWSLCANLLMREGNENLVQDILGV